MKPTAFLILLTALSPFAALHAHEDCACATDMTATMNAPDVPKRHPLKGVVVDVLADKSALLVKHEEIPGVMKAMTMLLQVDADTLKSPAATKGAAITGMLVRKADGWWLEEVQPK
jgi:Cu/Ag efflux protein CusF